MENPYSTPKAILEAPKGSQDKKAKVILCLSALALAIAIVFELKEYPAAGSILFWIVFILAFFIPWASSRLVYMMLMVTGYAFVGGWLERNSTKFKYGMTVVLVGVLVYIQFVDLSKW